MHSLFFKKVCCHDGTVGFLKTNLPLRSLLSFFFFLKLTKSSTTNHRQMYLAFTNNFSFYEVKIKKYRLGNRKLS